MYKDFENWNDFKKNLHLNGARRFFNKREIWWCSIGINIGFEQDGKSSSFERPIIVLKKFNKDTCLIVPLTTNMKNNKYFFYLGNIDGKNASAILSQIRLIDSKRLINKVSTLDSVIFNQLIDETIKINFNTNSPPP